MADETALICAEVCRFRGVNVLLLTCGQLMKLLMSGSDCRLLTAVVSVCTCLQLLLLHRVLRQSYGRTQMQTDWPTGGDDTGVRQQWWILVNAHKSKPDGDKSLKVC